MSLSIVFEDEDILVVCKPAGLGTQAPIAFDSLEARVRAYLSESAASDATPYLGIPHRLDRCVSGTIVFAKRRKAAQRLSKQFELRSVIKTYVANVAGRVEPASGEWRDHLRKIPDEPRGEVVPELELTKYSDAKLAVLTYEVLRCDEKTSELKIQLETGRMHQIRLQAAARNHPVVGDRMYGSEIDFGPTPNHERERHIALHASELTFEHPRSREQVTFASPVPEA